MKVSVSYLKHNQSKEETIEKLNTTTCDFIHVDLMDGIFAGEKNYGREEILKLFQNNQKPLDMHFMIENPSLEIEQFAILNPSYMTIPKEIPDFQKYLKKIKGLGIPCGLAINPETSLDEAFPYLDEVDQVLIMSVNPGKGGQSFQEEIVQKLKLLKQYREELHLNFVISVDGGINEDTIGFVKDFVDLVVSGSYVCLSSDFEKQIVSLKKG